MTFPKYIDLSGYSFTGKSAFNNLFAEFSGVDAHAFDFEFDIVRTKDGIADLFSALVENWSPVRSSEAIRCFKKVVKSYGGNKTLQDRLLSQGRHYDAQFPGFSKASESYINDLIDESWRGQWPYAFERTSSMQICSRKLLYNLGFKRIFESTVYLASPSKDYFISRTQAYLEEVLFSRVKQEKTVVMNNVLEPFNPMRSMSFFSDIKSIIIDRDPRDIYLAAWDYTNTDGSKGWRATLGKDVQGFVRRFVLYRQNIEASLCENVMRISFEDLVLDYDATLKKLFEFLEVDASVHENKKRYFDPDISIQGVERWKSTSRKDDVDYIYQNLKEYCKG